VCVLFLFFTAQGPARRPPPLPSLTPTIPLPQPKVPTATKVELIHRLASAGVPVVEATAFVSAKAVPQMADAADVMAGLVRAPGTRYPVLTPNLKGFELAVGAGADEVAIFASATEAFSKANLNASIGETLARYADVVAAAKEAGVRVRGYVSCGVGCPYSGPVSPAAAADVAARLFHDLGCFEVSMGDTIGVGTPAGVVAMFDACVARGGVPLSALASHCHDTYGQGVANVLAALAAGVTVHDTAVAGLGGCPFAPGASGNVATEDVVYMLDGLGVRTGIDVRAVAAAGAWISAALGRPDGGSRAGRALAADARRRAGAVAA
jgi:isopropylmalate/homocitrate/citramalate synthase